ncbi:MAG TPA: N-acyl homoserine lactonase family protein [Gemmatimonadaceae bacterium]|nr:N-acyl homoserine lactonase family protein [Gemmatimonadaceae bacterium]
MVALALSSAGAQQKYEVYAVRYATIPFKVSNLIMGADTSRKLDIAMMVILIKGGGRNILLDAGFYREKFMNQWKPQNYVRPDSAVLAAGVKPEDITDVIVSHVHWDHFDGADLFPKARIWIQREEVEHYIDSTGARITTDSAGRRMQNAMDQVDATMLQAIRAAGRLQLAPGDAKEIIPGITVYTGGKHTWQSQYAGVRTIEGTVILASDNVYLYENLDKHVPIAQTVDRESNVAAQDRMKTLASNPKLIVPGHDPAVFERFQSVKPNVVRIK